MLGALQRHLPEPRYILSLFAAIAGLVYAWSIISSFYMLPSWLFYLGVGQVLAIYAYAFLTAFVESVVLLLVVVLADTILLRRLLGAGGFLARSVLASFAVLISAVVRLKEFKHVPAGGEFLRGEGLWWLVTAAVVMVLIAAAHLSKRLRRVTETLAERATVFLPIYLPLTLIAAVVVFWRLLL